MRLQRAIDKDYNQLEYAEKEAVKFAKHDRHANGTQKHISMKINSVLITSNPSELKHEGHQSLG